MAASATFGETYPDPPRGGEALTSEDIVFAISDTGQGIPVDKLDMVFERFVQLGKHDRRGVGLGLYISKCIIEGHGGRMWADNRAGGGSTFSFTLPTR
jgi:signal transduction histidine kinase